MPQLSSRLRHSRVSTPRRSGGLLMQPSEVGEWQPPAHPPARAVIPPFYFCSSFPLRPPPLASLVSTTAIPSAIQLPSRRRHLPTAPATTVATVLISISFRTSGKMLITTSSRGKIIAYFFAAIPFYPIFALPKTRLIPCRGSDSVAQLVEQYTFNVWVLGSSPSGITNKKRSLQVNGFEGFSFLRLHQKRPFKIAFQ